MIEFIDNLSQFLVTLLGGILSGILFFRSRKSPYFLLCSFYGCFALAGLYWLLYTILVTDAPPMFYVSDIGWIAGYLFLCLLQDSLSDREERAFRCGAMWIAPLVIVPLTIYYISLGDVIYNLILDNIMLVLTWRGIRGFVYWKRKAGLGREKRFFHLAILCFVVLENGLWLSSYPWVSDTLTNPYFWIDFAVTACLFSLFPATRKAVEA